MPPIQVQPEMLDWPTFIAIAASVLLAVESAVLTWLIGDRHTVAVKIEALEKLMNAQATKINGLEIHKETHAERLEEIRDSVKDTCGKLDRIINKQGEMMLEIQRNRSDNGGTR